MSGPLVSVIIATYNYGHFISDALLSVSEQSYQHWECIIVDDGSTDDTASIVKAYILGHPKQQFKYISIKNSGPSNARNEGIKQSSGVYLQFLDADDVLLKEKLFVQVQLMQNELCSVVFSKSNFFVMQGLQKVYRENYPAGFLALQTLGGLELIERLVKNNILTISSALVRKKLVVEVGMFNVGSSYNEDWLLWFKIALLAPLFIFDDSAATATEIRMHQQSISLAKQKMFEGEVFVRQQFNDLLDNQFGLSEVANLIQYNQALLALHQIRSLDLKSGIAYVLKTFAKAPKNNINLLGLACIKLTARILKK
ncbi:MAG: glycosyltransferase family 2 protein [Flavobacteriales bacterium]|nr:MAG: glycosyltransferase family 2 protein [Flavobacteriales bacterium]